jgi:hypothetical protein
MPKTVVARRPVAGSSPKPKARGSKAQSAKAKSVRCSLCKTAYSPSVSGFGISRAAAGLTQYGDAVVAPYGRHPQRHAELFAGEVNHTIHVMSGLSARQLVDYCTGVAAKLSNSLLALDHAPQPFGLPHTPTKELAINRDCSAFLARFSDALESAINCFCAVEHIALSERNSLDNEMANGLS